MISSTFFLTALTRHGYRLFTGVPCSYLKPFINQVIDNDALRYVPAANEGDAVAIASGAELGATASVVMFQNSGLGNAVSPLTSLNAIFQIPVLLIVTWRGEPGGKPDEPQHALMGAITTQMLDLVGVRWEMCPTAGEEVEPALERAVAHMRRTRLPYAFVMREGSVTPHALASNQIFCCDRSPITAARGLAGRTAVATGSAPRHSRVSPAAGRADCHDRLHGSRAVCSKAIARISSIWSARWAAPRASASAWRSRSPSGE